MALATFFVLNESYKAQSCTVVGEVNCVVPG